MGIRKLSSLVKEAFRTAYRIHDKSSVPDPIPLHKIVWLGDTGQGDVCAGVCFIDPAQCDPKEIEMKRPEERHMELFVNKIINSPFVHYKWAIEWIQSQGKRVPADYVQEYISGPYSKKLVEVDMPPRYGLFHHVPDPRDEDGEARPMTQKHHSIKPRRGGWFKATLTGCFKAAEALAMPTPGIRPSIQYFGMGDKGHRKFDYEDGITKAAEMDLLNENFAKQLLALPGYHDGFLTDDTEKAYRHRKSAWPAQDFEGKGLPEFHLSGASYQDLGHRDFRHHEQRPDEESYAHLEESNPKYEEPILGKNNNYKQEEFDFEMVPPAGSLKLFYAADPTKASVHTYSPPPHTQ